ncbi:MAG: DUF359 domain-containing protein [Thermoplasmata archaeon]
MPRVDTPSASSSEEAWVVPESLRGELAARYRPPLSGGDAEAAYRALGNDFATCGDRVSADAIRLGRLPRIAIVDYVTRREEAVDRFRFRVLADRRSLRVPNPAGMLTDRLYTAVGELWKVGGGLIEVDGEEDLGTLALIAQLPLGATVIYGIPGEGASFVRVDLVTKDRVRNLLDRMERRRVDLGD